MASPIAWEHHYGVLMPIYACLLPRVATGHAPGRGALLALAVSYLLTSNFIFVVNEVVATPSLQALPAATLVQSYLFAGALMALACLFVLRHSRQPSAADVVVTGEGTAVPLSV